MKSHTFNLVALTSILVLAACQDPKEPKAHVSHNIRQSSHLNAAVGLLGVMSNTNNTVLPDAEEESGKTEQGFAPEHEISMSPYVLAASNAARQLDDDRAHCATLPAAEQESCLITADANYEVTSAGAETLLNVPGMTEIAGN